MMIIIKLTEGAVIVSTLDKVKEGRALGGRQNLRKVPLKRERNKSTLHVSFGKDGCRRARV
jgi:hypothetical protein